MQEGPNKSPSFPMKRLNRILTILLRDWKDLSDEGRDFPIRWNIMHMYSSSQIAKLLALRRGLDPELSAIAAALHDFGVVMTKRHEGHADAGGAYVDDFIEAYNLKEGPKVGVIKEDEKAHILNAIAQHSDKEADSGDPLVELLKDADSLDRYLHGIKTQGAHLRRCQKAMKELAICF